MQHTHIDEGVVVEYAGLLAILFVQVRHFSVCFVIFTK